MTDSDGNLFDKGTDAEADALWEQVAGVVRDYGVEVEVCDCGCGEVSDFTDLHGLVDRIRSVVQPMFDQLREEIQALQVSDGYQSGWEHGVQAATAHHMKNSAEAATRSWTGLLPTALRRALRDIDDGHLILRMTPDGRVLPDREVAGLRGDWWDDPLVLRRDAELQRMVLTDLARALLKPQRDSLLGEVERG